MAPYQCGPYFTFAPTDANGGGLVHMAVVLESPRNEGSLNDTGQVISFTTGSVRAHLCQNCSGPQATQTIDNGSVRIDLVISREQLQQSACLRHIKVAAGKH